jgi:AraC-like DNA-binding protein
MTTEQIKAYYIAIINKELDDSRLDERVEIIRILERETGLDFKNTADFKAKMNAFLARASDTCGTKLREERKRRGWSIETLAKILDMSPRHLARMEAGSVRLSRVAFEFLYGDGSEKTKSRIQRIGGADRGRNDHPATTPTRSLKNVLF